MWSPTSRYSPSLADTVYLWSIFWPSNSFVTFDFQIGGVLSSNMEQLNKKRTDLRNQQKVLNDKIGKSEEKKLFLENKKGVLESRRDELNCKSQVFDF